MDQSLCDTVKVTDMSNLFGGCSSLKEADLSSFDTAKTRNMNAMFAGCKSLTSLDLSGFTSKRLQSTTKMFMDVGRLETFICTDEKVVKAYRTR